MRPWPHYPISSALLLVALLVLAACATSAPATPQAYSTTKACGGTYATSDYSIQCHAGWQVTTLPSIPATQFFTSSQRLMGMTVSSPVGPVTTSQYGTLLYESMSRANVVNITITANGMTKAAGVNQWTLTATGSGNSGTTPYTYQQYSTYHNNVRYMVVVYAPTASFTSMARQMLAMLATWHFH